MARFKPFRQFQEELFSRPFLAGRDVAEPAVAGTAMKQEDVHDYLQRRYANVEVSNSFVDAVGQHIDCVRLNQQPALRGEGPDPPPAFIEMPGTSGRRESSGSAPLAEDRADQFGNQVYCPPGFVPLLRVTPDRVARAGGLEQFFDKAPGGGKHPSFGAGIHANVRKIQMEGHGGLAIPMQEVAGAIHAYAHASQSVAGQQCTGARSWFNTWTPDPSPGVFSLSQLWISGDDGSGVQTIEGGCHVYPDLYNDPKPVTRLFVYWTADGYQTTGSYNLSTRPGQGGFVQVDHTWVLGGAFASSVTGGDQHGFLMQWQRDASNGNWWLFLQGSGEPVAVGYFPASLYGSGPLSQAAQHVDFGGEVCSQQGDRRTGPMGSGQPASSGWEKAAFQKEIAYLTSGGWTAASLTPDQRDAPAYTIDLHNDSSSAWSTYFFFGGIGAVFP